MRHTATAQLPNRPNPVLTLLHWVRFRLGWYLHPPTLLPGIPARPAPALTLTHCPPLPLLIPVAPFEPLYPL